MLILTRSDVESLLTMQDAIEAVERGFRELARGNVSMPQRAATPVTPHKGLHLSMPAYVGGEVDALSIKIVTVYGDNPARYGLPTIQGALLLHDAATGALLAMMDAEYLTAMRTGAVSGVATQYLAREDASIVTLFGAGAQAGAQLAAMCTVRPIEQAFVITRTGTKDLEFCLRMENELGIPVLPCRNTRVGVESADIICTATNSHTPLFNGNWLQDGAHVNAVGAYTTQMRELDTHTIQTARIFVDSHEAAQAEAGDITIPIARGKFSYDRVAGELGRLINGEIPGRTCNSEITVFKSVGLAIQDAVTAASVYAKAVASGLGRKIKLN
jgi:ornithine cyclodeaminase/alanine dehydrogenase